MDVSPLDEEKLPTTIPINYYFNSDSMVNSKLDNVDITLEFLLESEQITTEEYTTIHKVIQLLETPEVFCISLDEIMVCIDLYKYLGFTIGGFYYYDKNSKPLEFTKYYYELLATLEDYSNVDVRINILSKTIKSAVVEHNEYSTLIIEKLYKNNKYNVLLYNIDFIQKSTIVRMLRSNIYYSKILINTKEKLHILITNNFFENANEETSNDDIELPTYTNFQIVIYSIIHCIEECSNILELLEYIKGLMPHYEREILNIAEDMFFIPYLKKYGTQQLNPVTVHGAFDNIYSGESFTVEDVDFILDYYNPPSDLLHVVDVLTVNSTFEVFKHTINHPRIISSNIHLKQEWYTNNCYNDFTEKLVYVLHNKLNLVEDLESFLKALFRTVDTEILTYALNTRVFTEEMFFNVLNRPAQHSQKIIEWAVEKFSLSPRIYKLCVKYIDSLVELKDYEDEDEGKQSQTPSKRPRTTE
jgi:hypothetical protein